MNMLKNIVTSLVILSNSLIYLSPITFLAPDASDQEISEALIWCYNQLQQCYQSEYSKKNLNSIEKNLRQCFKDVLYRLTVLHCLKVAYCEEVKIITPIHVEATPQTQQAIELSSGIQRKVNKLLYNYGLLSDAYGISNDLENKKKPQEDQVEPFSYFTEPPSSYLLPGEQTGSPSYTHKNQT